MWSTVRMVHGRGSWDDHESEYTGPWANVARARGGDISCDRFGNKTLEDWLDTDESGGLSGFRGWAFSKLERAESSDGGREGRLDFGFGWE